MWSVTLFLFENASYHLFCLVANSLPLPQFQHCHTSEGSHLGFHGYEVSHKTCAEKSLLFTRCHRRWEAEVHGICGRRIPQTQPSKGFYSQQHAPNRRRCEQYPHCIEQQRASDSFQSQRTQQVSLLLLIEMLQARLNVIRMNVPAFAQLFVLADLLATSSS